MHRCDGQVFQLGKLIVPLLSGAGCLAERPPVSVVRVGTPYRKRQPYVVAVKACREGGYDSRLFQYTFHCE